MVTSKKVGGTAMSMPMGVLAGLATSSIITIGLVVALTWMTIGGKIREGVIGYVILGILLVASSVGSMVSALKIQRRRILVCCITGVAYYLLLLLVTALFFGGNFRGIGVTGGTIFVGSLISGYCSLGIGSRGRNEYKRRNHW